MSDSQKFLRLQNILSESLTLKNLLNLIRAIAQKHENFFIEQFSTSSHLKFLIQEFNKLKIEGLNSIMDQLSQPNSIIALPIKMEPKFTLFFVLVPPGQKFDWHSHPKMTGVSKCIHGHLEISTLSLFDLHRYKDNTYVYPKNKVRVESLYWNSTTTVSTIEPKALNIHKIQAKQFSAFFDLLMPDYPDNTCQFFTTNSENPEQLLLQELTVPRQEIKGWDVALKQIINRQKNTVKTVILQ